MKDEIEEYFSYSEEEQARLMKAQEVFEERWRPFDKEDVGWEKASHDLQKQFLEDVMPDLISQERTKLTSAMLCLLYLALGCWAETARCKERRSKVAESLQEENSEPCDADEEQLLAIKRNVRTMIEVMGLSMLFDSVCTACAHL